MPLMGSTCRSWARNASDGLEIPLMGSTCRLWARNATDGLEMPLMGSQVPLMGSKERGRRRSGAGRLGEPRLHLGKDGGVAVEGGQELRAQVGLGNVAVGR
jgi:hypothetical protein